MTNCDSSVIGGIPSVQAPGVENTGKKYSWDFLSNRGYKRMLNMKLLREINDYIETDTDDELADIAEFILAIYEYRDIYLEKIEVTNLMISETRRRSMVASF